MRGITRSLAKCDGFDVSAECGLMMAGHFAYEDGGCQGFGYMIDDAFIIRFMRVFGVKNLREVNAKSCWVTHDDSKIYKVEPLHKKDGSVFDIDAWIDWVSRRGSKASPYELETGELPPGHVR